ncbi:transketolase C-terminal domain-containing protein [Nocardioides pantholopis]|uniref:transketolase C-terminal domain-containing protein n=1 Tax=Nocardioides pantholopis TaxID=2483798 RepID=UPI000FDCD9A7
MTRASADPHLAGAPSPRKASDGRAPTRPMDAPASPTAATRAAAKAVVIEQMQLDHRVVCIDTDTGLFAASDFAQCPERYLNIGIAEHTAVSVAAGLAREGMRPVVFMFAAFAVNRAADAIKLNVAYANLPIVLIGTHAGLSAGFLGATHHCLEDLGLMRALPNVAVVAPGDALQAAQLLRQLLAADGPSYLRLGRRASPVLLGDSRSVLGVPQVVASPAEGVDRSVTVFACGPEQLAAAHLASEALGRDGTGVTVVNVHTLKPLFTDAVVDLLPEPSGNTQGLVVTLEEHWRSGGLGDAIADILTAHSPRRMLRLAVPDTFCATPGDHAFQVHAAGLDASSITARIRAGLADAP